MRSYETEYQFPVRHLNIGFVTCVRWGVGKALGMKAGRLGWWVGGDLSSCSLHLHGSERSTFDKQQINRQE